MGCKKGKKCKCDRECGLFECKKCGYVSEKKDGLCKPKKVK